MDEIEEQTASGLVLVVDDDPTFLKAHRAILARQFDVVTAASGAEAIQVCRARLPDLVLLDIDMADIDGIETCRQLREWTSIPIIFATGHEGIIEHVKAYDAGGDDLLIKPVQPDILVRKVELAIIRSRTATQLTEEKNSLQHMAMSFLSNMGQNGALLNFMRASIGCRSHRSLAEQLLTATRELGVTCSVMIRHAGGQTVMTAQGDPTPIELGILEQASAMGRIFQFRQRLVVNYPHTSIIVADMPDEAEDPVRAGQLRDNIAILAEVAEGLCDNVDMRLESMRRAEQLQVALGGGQVAVEQLRGKYLSMVGDIRLLLRQLEDKVELRFGWFGASQEQETAVSNEMGRSATSILQLLAEGSDFESNLSQVFNALKGGANINEAEMF